MKDLLFSSRAKMRLQRRLFLKALGLGLSAPLAYRLIESATASPGAIPKRFLLYYIPHGMPPEHFNPVGEGSEFALDQSGVSVLGGLEPYKNLVNVYEGFNYPGADTHQGIVKFLSNYQGTDADDTGERTSIEHFIGNELQTGTLALGACAHNVFGQQFDGKLMWDGTAVVPQKNPLVAYDDVFGGLAGGGAAPDSTQDELYQSLLTLNEGEIQGLQSELSGLTGVQNKLAIHLESIQALRAGGGGTISCSSAPALAQVEAVRAASMGSPESWFLDFGNFELLLQAQLELAAASMICNARPVTAVQPLYANADFDFANIQGGAIATGAHHSVLSHSTPQISGGNINLMAREAFAKSQKWFVDMLVEHVVKALDVEDPACPGTTVLDNTVIMLCSEIGEGAWHISESTYILTGAPPGLWSYMPLVTIGGAGGALNTGQRLNYADTSDTNQAVDRPAGDLLLTLAQAMGVPATDFGGATSPVVEALT